MAHATRMVAALIGMVLGASGLGGTCSEPPPWHGVSGTWVNATWGPEGTVTLERQGQQGVVVDLDVAMSVTSTVPVDRTPLPVQGAVCVSESSGLGLAGTYTIDPAASTWVGSDYGGARMDVVARASDGRIVEIDQAFMHNASPDKLDNAIFAFKGADGATLGIVRFEDFRRSADAICPR